MVKEFASWNAKPFLSSLLPNNEFVGRGKAPKSVDDFKGMRVRALAGIGAAMKKIGAIPTSVDATEVYTSLERGTVDAAAFPATYATSPTAPTRWASGTPRTWRWARSAVRP